MFSLQRSVIRNLLTVAADGRFVGMVAAIFSLVVNHNYYFIEDAKLDIENDI